VLEFSALKEAREVVAMFGEKLVATLICAVMIGSLLIGTWACADGDESGNTEFEAATGVYAEQHGFTNEELEAILAEFLIEEIESIDCECETCEDAVECIEAGKELYRRWGEEYWRQYQIYLLGDDTFEEEFDQLGMKLAECIEDTFINCDCDIECLRCLLNAIYQFDGEEAQFIKRVYGYDNLIDLLMGFGPLDVPWYMSADSGQEIKQIVGEILDKLKECGYEPEVTEEDERGESQETGEEQEVDEAERALDELMRALREEIEERTEDESEEWGEEAEKAFKRLDDLLKGGVLKEEGETGTEEQEEGEATTEEGTTEADEAFEELDELLGPGDEEEEDGSAAELTPSSSAVSDLELE
jgi:hypothetical protein